MVEGLAHKLAERLVDQLSGTRKLPQRAAKVLADTIVVMTKGAKEPEIQQLAMALAIPHGLSSMLAGTRFRSTPDRAALVNASGATFLELDEGFRPTGHPAVHLVPALLAEIESRSQGATMRELLASLTFGYEVIARLATSLEFDPEVHPHGHIGSVGVAAALGHVRGWPVERLAKGMAIAASLPIRTDWRACFTGDTIRNTYVGVGASIGFLALDLVEAGFTADNSSIEGILAPALGRGIRAKDFLRPNREWAIDHGYFKFYAACALTHPSTEAALSLLKEGPWDCDSIKEVHVEVPERYMRTAKMPNGTRLSAKFSIPWSVAGTLLTGLTDDSLYQEPLLSNPEIQRVASRVFVRSAPDLTQRFPQFAGARLLVVRRSGAVVSASCDEPRGGPQRGTTWQELRRKAEQLLPGLNPSWWELLTTYSDETNALHWWTRVRESLCSDLSRPRSYADLDTE